MKVKVTFLTGLRQVTGTKEADIDLPEGSTVSRLLEELSNRFGEPFKKYVYDERNGEPRKYLQFLLDGVRLQSAEGLETKLHGGEEFTIVTPVGAG